MSRKRRSEPFKAPDEYVVLTAGRGRKIIGVYGNWYDADAKAKAMTAKGLACYVAGLRTPKKKGQTDG